MPGEREAEDAIAAPGRRTEERLRQEEDWRHRMVPLRNGAGQMALTKAALAEAQLDGLLRDDPQLFEALRALAEGRREEVSRDQVKALRKEGFVTGSGRVRGDLQMVMRASYEETATGPSIASPFDTANPTDAEAVRAFLDREARAGEQAQALIKRLASERNRGRKPGV